MQCSLASNELIQHSWWYTEGALSLLFFPAILIFSLLDFTCTLTYSFVQLRLLRSTRTQILRSTLLIRFVILLLDQFFEIHFSLCWKCEITNLHRANTLVWLLMILFHCLPKDIPTRTDGMVSNSCMIASEVQCSFSHSILPFSMLHLYIFQQMHCGRDR